jgi:hypothetical protein
VSKVRGVQVSGGFTAPQLLVQFTPLFWGVAASWCNESAAVQVGPFAVKLSWGGYLLEAFAGRFDSRYATYKEARVWPKMKP